MADFIATYSTAVLQAFTRTGKLKFWQGHVLVRDQDWFTQTSYWQSKKDGTLAEIQWSAPYQVEVKNAGRTNEVLPEQQALLEVQRDYQKQLDRGYALVGEEPDVFPQAMKAARYSESGHHVTCPAFMQPKLNGQRMQRQPDVAWSRGNKEILKECVAHIQAELTHLPPGLPLDGELMLPGNQLLQATMAAIKEFKPDITPTLIYWVYDLADLDKPFSERYQALKQLLPQDLPHIRLTPTVTIKSTEEIVPLHRAWVAEGYEGSMVRFDYGGYEPGHRSVQLQKIKDYQDSEFEVLDIIEGKGNAAGAAIFVCKANDTRTFKCVPECADHGGMQHRRELYANRAKILSQKCYLTVKYQELSAAGVPIGNPTGILPLRETQTEGY